MYFQIFCYIYIDERYFFPAMLACIRNLNINILSQFLLEVYNWEIFQVSLNHLLIYTVNSTLR